MYCYNLIWIFKESIITTGFNLSLFPVFSFNKSINPNFSKSFISSLTDLKSLSNIFERSYDFEGISTMRKLLSNEKARILNVIKEKNPNVKIVGVQSKSFPSMYESLKQNTVISCGGERTIADGISVKTPGELTFSIIKELIDDIVLVDDTEITKAMFLLMERMKFVVEPAGAASLAYLISNKPAPGKKVVAVMAGGNVDMYLLGQIVDKGLAAMGRLLVLSMVLPDRPGIFKEIVDEIALANANIVEVVHDRLSSKVSAGSVTVTLSLETQGKEQADLLINALRAKNIQFTLLT